MSKNVVLFVSGGQNQLWVTDGTASGTSSISVAGTYSSFTILGGEALFKGTDSNLWVTDGTSSGTSELFAAAFPSNNPDIIVIGSKALFAAGGSLFVTDGTTAGTSEILAGREPLGPSYLAAFGSEALFAATTPGGTPNQVGLWVTDGTAPGTSELSVAGAGVGSFLGFNPAAMTVFGSEVLFAGQDAAGQYNLWVTDGTSGGTSELSVAGASTQGLFDTAILPLFQVRHPFVLLGSKVLFAGVDANNQINLWVTDGTTAGTSELLIPGAGPGGLLANLSLFSVEPIPPTQEFTVFGSEVLFAATGVGGGLHLVATDGSVAGTSDLFASPVGIGLDPTNPFSQTVFGDKVLFAGNHNLWVTDGTPSGTSELSVAGAYAAGLDPTGFTVLGSEVLFSGRGAGDFGQTSLWVTDGTAAGTSEITNTPVDPRDLVALTILTPTISSVTVTGAGISGGGGQVRPGSVVTLTVSFDDGVTVTGGTPTLALNDGGTATYDAPATAALGDPTKLVFDYTVNATDHDVNGLAIVGSSLNGATITGAAGHRVDYAGLLTSFPNLDVFVTGIPAVMSVTPSPARGIEGLGQTIIMTIALSKAVAVSGGTPTLLLNDGGIATYDAAATAALGDPTKLVFSYTVTSADHDVNALAIVGESPNGATIVDASGNSADFSAALTTLPGLQIIAVAPTVKSVTSSPASAFEGIGQTITLTVALSAPVTVAGGTPTLALNDGGTATYDAPATQALGDPTKLVFDYTVGANDQNVDALVIVGGSLNGAIIADAAGNRPDYSGLLTSLRGLHIAVAPAIESVTASPASGIENVGQTVSFTVALSAAVTVTGGTPTLSLNDGGTAIYDPTATAALGDPTKLVFDYTVGASDQNMNALAIVGGSLNGASITDAAGRSVNGSGLPTSFPGLSVATSTLLAFVTASPASGTERLGQSIVFTLGFNDGVTVVGGTPTLMLNDGGTAIYDAAATAALNDPTRLVFDHTVSTIDHMVNALAIVGGSLNGATILDAAGNTPDFGGVLQSFNGLRIDPSNAALFAGNEFGVGVTNLWVTDGTADRTSELSVAGAASGGLTPSGFTVFGSKVLFAGTDASNEINLWVTDGTVGGTSELSVAGASSGGLFAGGLAPQFTMLGNEMLFVGNDANNNPNLWVTDGTPAGTSELAVAGADASGLFAGGVASGFTVLGGEVFFRGVDANKHANLWVTDGTAGGTSELSIAGAYSGGLLALSQSPDFTVLGSEVLLAGLDFGFNSQVWVTDGTAGGTSELSVGAYSPSDFTVFGSEVLFAAQQADGRSFLWETDGTAAGTSELSLPGMVGSLNPSALVVLGGKVLFEGAHATGQGYGLWVTDGTASGTSELSITGARQEGIFVNGSAIINPDFTVLGSEVLFAGEDASDRITLWVSDGTAGGTSELSVAGATISNPNDLTVLGSEVLFASGGGLWETDGTDGGTSEISLAAPGSLNVSSLTPFVRATAPSASFASGMASADRGGGTTNNNSASAPGIDLANITFGGATMLAYAPDQSNAGSALTVSDGTHDATIALLGQYMAGDFHSAGDFHGEMLDTNPTPSGASIAALVTLPHT